eukprot:scaffold96575_cov68-Attheya_sp.AAC.1
MFLSILTLQLSESCIISRVLNAGECYHTLVSTSDFEALVLSGLQEVQGLFPVALQSASDGLEVVFHCPK